MELDNEMNFILKEQPMWFCKLSIKEKMDIAMLLQRYKEQLNILPVSNNEVAVCPCDKLPGGEIAISSKALQKPYGDLGQTDC